MAATDGTPNSNSNTYIIDIESGAETARLIEQDKLITRAMGGLFPEQPDLSSVRRILDIGCGPGGWVIDVAFQYPEIEIVGVDINPTMMKYAQAQIDSRRYANASFQVMDVTGSLAFPDASFDLVNARFIAGFLNKLSWLPLLNECMRVLTPGGRLRLTEAEVTVSSSLALHRLNDALFQALFRQGRSFSVDGHSLGVVHQLGRLLQTAGATQIETRSYHLDASYGSELHTATYKNNEVVFALLKPYLVASGTIDEATYDALYDTLLVEMLDENYTNIMFGLTATGRKM